MTSAARRRAVADAIDALDNEIATLQDSKRDTFEDYRDKLAAEGMRDGEIKVEIKALKKAIARRRALISKPAEVEEFDEKVDEITVDIMKNSVSGTKLAAHGRVARRVTHEAEPAFDPATGEVLGDVPARAGEILTQDGTRFAAAEMNATEQQKAEAAARGFPAPASQPSASTPLRTLPPRVPEPAPEMPDLPAFLDRRNERAEAAAE
jgi:hypothetical protein